MKLMTLPYFRSFLLLTFGVCLLGNAKIILLHKQQIVGGSLMASTNKVPQRSRLQPLAKTLTKPAHNVSKIRRSNHTSPSNVVAKSSVAKPINTIRNTANTAMTMGKSLVPKQANTQPIVKKIDSIVLDDQTAETEVSNNIPEELISDSTFIDSTHNDSIDRLNAELDNLLSEASNDVDADVQNTMPKAQENKRVNPNNDYAFQGHSTLPMDLALQAERRLQSRVTYDGRYVKIGYPMGDVPEDIGVCTDVVIRSLRGLGIDLQQGVHEDMKRNFHLYPQNWQLTRPDSNIDHRRVPNLMKYFERANMSMPITHNPRDYYPGDIVAWEMGNGLTHIGIVSTYTSEKTNNPLIVHNIGVGPEMTDILFDFKIIGHYKPNHNLKKPTLVALGF